MNTRFLPWTVVAICSTGVAACGSDSPSIPTAPILSTLPPAPPLPPARWLAVDLTGTYALPFEVRQACEQIPKELRIRTYEARIEYKSSHMGRCDDAQPVQIGEQSVDAGAAVSVERTSGTPRNGPSPLKRCATMVAQCQ